MESPGAVGSPGATDVRTTEAEEAARYEIARARRRAQTKSLQSESTISAKMAQSIASEVRAWLIQNASQMSEAFAEADTDGDGRLSIEELVTMVEPITRGHLTLKQLRLAFEHFDNDKSGFLDRYEFMMAFHVPEGSDRSVPALMRAVDFGDAGLVRAKLAKRPDIVDGKYYKGSWTALMGAAYSGQVETAQALIDAKAKVDAVDSGGWSALHHAASNNHADVIGVLCYAGANAVLRSQEGRTPMDVARALGNHAAVDAMRPYAGGTTEGSFDRRGHPTFARGLPTVLDDPEEVARAPPDTFLTMSFDDVLAKSRAALEDTVERWNLSSGGGEDDGMWKKVLGDDSRSPSLEASEES